MSNNADEFLKYVADNSQQLKRNLRKNITFDGELFDDIFGETIIKCYDSIVKQNMFVEDFEKFFFIASKFNFIQAQNKKRRQESRRIDIEDYRQKEVAEEQEEADEERPVPTKYIKVCETLSQYFGDDRKNLFLDFYNQKVSGNPVNLEELSDKYSLRKEFIETSIKQMTRFLKKNCNDKYIKSYPLF